LLTRRAGKHEGSLTGRKLKTVSRAMFPVFFFLCCFNVYAQFPEIKILDSTKDDVFKQFAQEVENNQKKLKTNAGQKEKARSLNIYLYKYNPEDRLFFRKDPKSNDLLVLEPRTVSRDALTTLNRWDSMRNFQKGEPILLPDMQGLFIPENPKTDFERLVAAARPESEAGGVWITVKTPKGEGGSAETRFRFIPGAELSSTERFFLTNPRRFQFPLKKFKLTSAFGMRLSPITGKPSMHGGLDLAAPLGTPAYAAAAGTVTETGDSPIYGKYLIITHDNGWTSLYGHLSHIDVTLNQEVKAGDLIGKVGSTGLSTGPHLHFEIRKDGAAKNPQDIVKKSGY